MFPNRVPLLAACFAALLAVGCGKSSSNNADVRVLNLIEGATGVTVTVGSTTVMSGASFETIGTYQGVGGGNVEFKVTVPGGTGTLIDSIYPLSGDIQYTYVMRGTPGAAAGALVADAYGSPGGNNFAVRVLNTSAIVPSIDLYLTAPGADLATATPVVSAATLGTVTAFVNTPAGALQMRLTTAGTKDVLYDATPPAFGVGTGQTIVAYGRNSSKLLNVAVMSSGTTGAIAANQLAQLKVANGTAVPAPLNVYVDGTLAVPGLPFAGIAPYQALAAGTRTVTVESTASPGAALLTLKPTLVPATDTTIALSGPAGALAGLVLADSNQAVVTGRAQLRVVNLSPDFAAVDVFANFGRIVAGLASNASSAYTLVDAAGGGTTYRFDFNLAGTTSVVASATGLVLSSGHVYTVYLLGTGATLQGVLTQDR